MDPLPNICKVYSFLVQQERQVITRLDEFEVLAIPNSKQNKNSQLKLNTNFHGRSTIIGGRVIGVRGRGNRVCSHCGMTNHIVDSFFLNHGYPPH